MSNCVAFHTQIASIMEVLANAAVAEICKLVDDGYAVFRLEMSQSQNENRTLKRKLQLIELRSARERAERTMRERIINCRSGGARTLDRIRGTPRGDGHFSARDRGAVKVGQRVWRGEEPITLVEDDPPTPQVVIIEEERPETDLRGKEPYDQLRMARERTVETVSDGGKQIPSMDTQPSFTPEDLSDQPGSGFSVQEVSGSDTVIKSEPETESVNQRLQHTGTETEHTAQRLSRCLTGENSRTLPSVRGGEIAASGRSCSFSTEMEADNLSVCPEAKPAPTADGASGFSGSSDCLDLKPEVLVVDSVPVKVEECVSPLSWNKMTDPGSSQPQCNNFLGQMEGIEPSPDINVVRSPSHALTNNATGSKVAHTDSNERALPYDQIFPNIPERATGPKEKRFFCSFCAKAFSCPKTVEIHQRVHTGEKPFSCGQCRMRFAQAGNLKRHQRVHTGEKPFGCTLCEKRFSHLHQLKMHLRVHSGERPFGCPHCGKRFAEKSYLKTHLQRSHFNNQPL